MKKLVYSDEAETAIRHIYRYTSWRWGEAQAERYIGDLYLACEYLADEDAGWILGRPVGNGWRMHSIGKHVIIYRETPSALEVLTILYQSMDIPARLKEMLQRRRKQ